MAPTIVAAGRATIVPTIATAPSGDGLDDGNGPSDACPDDGRRTFRRWSPPWMQAFRRRLRPTMAPTAGLPAVAPTMDARPSYSGYYDGGQAR